MPTEHPSEEEIGRLFGVLLAELRTLSLTNARAVVARAGITGVNAPKQYWDPFLTGVEQAFQRLDVAARVTAVRILADHFSESEDVRLFFSRHGFQYVGGAFVPVAFLDQRESLYLPSSSAAELAKAMKRLVDEDETGAVTAACGAVDTLMQELYRAHDLGNPNGVAFAAKVNTAAKQLRIFEDMKAELVDLGMNAPDAETIVVQMKRATNHAAQMLQVLRRTMGDVHGSKAALRHTAYDAVKWASAIAALFNGR